MLEIMLINMIFLELSSLIAEKRIKMTLFNAPDKWIGVTNPDDELIVREYLKR